MKDIPVIEPKEIITTITNMKTGEVYKDDAEWKAKGIAESDIRKDVRVIMPSLDLFGETKQNSTMAISRMQQPRQMYGLGSFVKKLTRKVTKPFTKVAKKIVPKEIAGIMRTAAPFLPPGYREAAYLLGTAKQTGRISPIDLALVAAPSLNKKLGKTDAGFFAETFPKSNQFLFGAPSAEIAGAQLSPNAPGLIGETITRPETTGILGSGGKMFQFGKDKGSVLDNVKAFRDQSKLGSLLLGDGDGGFSKSKIAGLGIGTLSLIQNSKTPEEAGNALVAATGNSDDYERGVELFSSLPQGIFDVPEQFRAKDGGLMRTNYAMGSGDDDDKPVLPEDPTKPINPFGPKPTGPVLPDKKMASYGYDDAMGEAFEEFLRLKKIGEIPADMEFDEYMDLLDIDRYLKKQKDRKGIMMAKEGGRANLALGTKPTAEESGLGGLPIEADMRYTGGFMPYGAKEKADDVPARLSKNEFVFTADAVRAAGGGSVNKGAKKMYQTMKQLEAKPEAKGMMA